MESNVQTSIDNAYVMSKIEHKPDLVMRTHVQRAVSGCFAALRQLRQIRSAVPMATFQSMVVALVMSRLDCGNCVLVGLPTHLVRRLQSVQNAAARLICGLRRFDHITDALVSLHWLRVQERVVYKIAVLTFKVLHGIAPEYLGPVVRVADLPGRRTLRSASTNRLVVPPYKLSTIGSRTFPVAGLQVWNSLPEDISSAPSLATFRRRLKLTFWIDHSHISLFKFVFYIVDLAVMINLGHSKNH